MFILLLILVVGRIWGWSNDRGKEVMCDEESRTTNLETKHASVLQAKDHSLIVSKISNDDMIILQTATSNDEPILDPA
jgi:hypothetical protein